VKRKSNFHTPEKKNSSVLSLGLVFPFVLLLLPLHDAREPRIVVVIVARDQRLPGLASGLQQSAPAAHSSSRSEAIASRSVVAVAVVALFVVIVFVASRLPPRCFDQRSVVADMA